MPGYFKPWRRKIGVMTLLLACALTLVWMRSNLVRDELTICSPSSWLELNWHDELASLDGSLCWYRYRLDPDHGGIGASSPFYFQSTPVTDYRGSSPRIEDTLKWQWEWAGFGFGAGGTHLVGMSAKAWMVPYWSLILPLTLISSWLLCSKSRPTKPQSISEFK